MAPLKILIIGSSIAGPPLATFLLLSSLPAPLKPHITLLERSHTLRTAGQNIDIRGPGIPIIRKLGVEAAIRASTTGEEGVQFVDAEDRLWAQFPADRSGRVSTPTADIEIMRGRLAEILVARSLRVSEGVQRDGGEGIEYVFGDYLDEIEQDEDGRQVHVRFAKSKQRRSFDIVVGADGLQSSTRRMVWGADGETDRVKRLGMYAAFFSMPRGKTDSAWRRWFHAPGRRGVMLRPDERRDRTTVFMYVINQADGRLPQAVAAKGSEGVDVQKALLAEYFQDAGWESKRIVREMMATDDFYYDLVGQVKMEKWSKGSVVLLGDAGYCASPISGMGTTLALNGAYNLAGALTRHPHDHTAAFAEYEEKMRPIVDRAQRLVPGMPHILNPETPWGVWMLNAIMFILAQSGLIHLLIKFVGPPTNTAAVEDYGFKQLPEWTEAVDDVVRLY